MQIITSVKRDLALNIHVTFLFFLFSIYTKISVKYNCFVRLDFLSFNSIPNKNNELSLLQYKRQFKNNSNLRRELNSLCYYRFICVQNFEINQYNVIQYISRSRDISIN